MGRVNVDITRLEEIQTQVKRFLQGSKSRPFFRSLVEQSKDIIYKRVKTGFGIDNDDEEFPSRMRLPKLSANYIKRRKRRPGKGSFFSPRRSNLTYTGQMLNAITSKALNDGFILAVKGSSRSDSKHTNKEIAEFVSDKGFTFFALTKSERRIIINRYREFVTQLAKRLIK